MRSQGVIPFYSDVQLGAGTTTDYMQWSSLITGIVRSQFERTCVYQWARKRWGVGFVPVPEDSCIEVFAPNGAVFKNYAGETFTKLMLRYRYSEVSRVVDSIEVEGFN